MEDYPFTDLESISLLEDHLVTFITNNAQTNFANRNEGELKLKEINDFAVSLLIVY